MSEAPYFHVAVLVPDLSQAINRFGQALGMTFASPINTQIPPARGQPATDLTTPFTYSRQGPPHIELIEAAGDGVFGAQRGYGVHHIGAWVDDPRASAQRLVDLDFHVEARLEDGTSIMAMIDPSDLFGVRLELCSLTIRNGWRTWLGGVSPSI